jgi:hypothetical protein
MVRRVMLAAVPALAVWWPVAAQAQPAAPTNPSNQVVLSGDVTIPRGTVIGEVVVFSGSATVAGVVQNDVVVLDGPVTVSGQVGGDVIALHGPIRLLDTAQITGNVLAGGNLIVAEGAQVTGDVRRDVGFTLAGPVGELGVLLVSIAMGVSILLGGALMLVLAPRGADRAADAARDAPLASAGWGVLAAIAVPLVAIALTATVLGLPLGLAALLGLAMLWLLGLVAATYAIGRLVVRAPRSRLGALLAGGAIGGAIGLVPILNGVWWVLGGMFGVGALVVAAWRARSGRVDLTPRGRSGRHRAAKRAAPAVEPASTEPEQDDVVSVGAAEADVAERTAEPEDVERPVDAPVAED